MTWAEIKSRMLNWLSHPGDLPEVRVIYERGETFPWGAHKKEGFVLPQNSPLQSFSNTINGTASSLPFWALSCVPTCHTFPPIWFYAICTLSSTVQDSPLFQKGCNIQVRNKFLLIRRKECEHDMLWLFQNPGSLFSWGKRISQMNQEQIIHSQIPPLLAS